MKFSSKQLYIRNKTGNTNSRMRVHQQQEHENIEHISNDCGKQTTSNMEFAKHENEDHGGRKYICRDCITGQ